MDGCWTAEDRAAVISAVVDGLWRYVGRQARDVARTEALVADLTGLAPADLETLRHLHLLLSDEVALFVDEALPRLLAHPRAATTRERVVGLGAIRGPIAWGATAAARARQGMAGGLYASLSAHKHLDTPEAQVLACLLRGLDRAAALIPDRLGAMEPAQAAQTEGWAATVGRVTAAVREASVGRPWMHEAREAREAREPDEPALAASLTACMRSTRAEYRALARVYLLYSDLVAAPTIPALLAALEQRVLLPLDDDVLYELWALLGVVKALEDGRWTLQTAALIGRNRVPFTYVSPDGRTTARLLFGHTPAAWRRASRYRAIFERYALPGATRRPDLVVELLRGRVRRHLLIEVKRTRDEGYIADSIYKVLGYLADFAAAFGDQEGARGLLLIWDAPLPARRAVRRGHRDDTLVLATHRTYQRQLRALFDALCP